MIRLVLAAAIALAWSPPAHAYRLPWCGFYMMHYFGKVDPHLALARNWAREGNDAGGPGAGVVVVWPHHVGLIVSRAPDGRWLVQSGNDGGRVRTRPWSLVDVIGFRLISTVRQTPCAWWPCASRLGAAFRRSVIASHRPSI